MRLIDADKIRYVIDVYYNEQTDEEVSGVGHTDEISINNIPTVNAIPVHWIKTWGRRHDKKDLVKTLLDDWREFDKTKLN